jgi:hypothetical protein
MAMATEPEVNRPLIWSSGTLEKRYFNVLQELHWQYSRFNDESRILNDGDLVDIMNIWGRRYKDTYALYIDNEDNIQQVQLSYDIAKDAKIILLRCLEGRWQACCHFEEARRSANTALVDLSKDQRPVAHLSIDSSHAQRPDLTATMSPEHNALADGVSNTSATVDPTTENLINTLERLASGVENLTLAVEARKSSENSLHVAIDKLIASLDKAAHDQTEHPLDEATNNYGSRASTEYDPGLNTPSTVQDTVTAESVSNLEDCDDAFTWASRYVTVEYDQDM